MKTLMIPVFTRLWLLLLCLGFFHLGLVCAALASGISAGKPLAGLLLQLGLIAFYASYALLCVVRALRVPGATTRAT